jgi:tripartite-type tricarboxylate transporter receptor subunit TctC
MAVSLSLQNNHPVNYQESTMLWFSGKVLGAVAGMAMAVAACGAGAQSAYPRKAIRIVVPFSAGSTTDIVARMVGERLAANLGQPVVVENRSGAGGTLGSAVVARAEPDGHTLLVNATTHTVVPSTYANLPYDVLRDFAGVSPLVQVPNVLVVAPGKNLRDLRSLVSYARAHPGKLNYASAGQGTATHLNAEKFKASAKIFAVHIPYRGSPEAVTDVLSGAVDYYFSPIAPVLQHIREGKLLALAVGSARRSAVLPNIPTTSEAGVPDSEFNFWIGMMAPAKTPRDVIAKLNREIENVLATPDVRESLARLGADVWTQRPEQFDLHLRREVESNAKLVKASGLKTQ